MDSGAARMIDTLRLTAEQAADLIDRKIEVCRSILR